MKLLTPGSPTAMKALDNLGARIDVDWYFQTIQAVSTRDIDPHSRDFQQSVMPVVEGTLWLSIQDLLGRAWFERLWIWQEIILPKNDISVLCGYSEINYRHFCKAIFFYYNHRLEFSGLKQAYTIATNSCRGTVYTLVRLLYETRGCKCSEQRDRIYSILGLIAERDQVNIEPDYSKPIREVLEHFVLELADTQHSLDILTLCWLQDSPLDMPTWVNWSVPTTVNRLYYGYANANTEAQAHSAGDDVLVITGVFVTTIDRCDIAFGILKEELRDTSSDGSVYSKAIAAIMKDVIGVRGYQ